MQIFIHGTMGRSGFSAFAGVPFQLGSRNRFVIWWWCVAVPDSSHSCRHLPATWMTVDVSWCPKPQRMCGSNPQCATFSSISACTYPRAFSQSARNLCWHSMAGTDCKCCEMLNCVETKVCRNICIALPAASSGARHPFKGQMTELDVDDDDEFISSASWHTHPSHHRPISSAWKPTSDTILHIAQNSAETSASRFVSKASTIASSSVGTIAEVVLPPPATELTALK